jgi:molecular chaperone HscB
VNHFDILGFPPRHQLDGAALDQRFRELSLQHHPDRVEASQRLKAVERTTSINEAYKTLRDPVRRAFYLLKLAGIDLDREDSAAQKQMPIEFLEEVMTLREELSEAHGAKNLDRVQAMARQVEGRRDQALKSAVEALDALPGELPRAAHELGRVRYFTRFLEEVERIEEEVLA